MRNISIAIDGPAGAGKSTIAKLLSKKLGINYLDTGAMYRAVALKVFREGVADDDIEAITKIVKDINIKICFIHDEQIMLLDDLNVNDNIRTKEISVSASNVGTIRAVREKMVLIQREISKNNSIVMDGRDIGSFVLPNADFKYFLTADIDERARRRYNEALKRGITNTTIDNVKTDIIKRDTVDSEREFAPLIKADDAIEIDTSNMSIEMVVSFILDYVDGHLRGEKNWKSL